ncbi:MAG: helix-turn-helix domain-containing protein [Bacillota bacterium]|nr:helix-turn-helix domain-containing protein [Bacillota bacterium]
MSEATHFSRQLRKLRLHRHMSQLELARSAGVTQQAIHAWEHGDGTPDPDMLCRLALCLDTTVDHLVACREALPERGRLLQPDPLSPRVRLCLPDGSQEIPDQDGCFEVHWQGRSMLPQLRPGAWMRFRSGDGGRRRGMGLIFIPDDGLYFARFHNDRDELLLQYHNTLYPERRLPASACHILALLVAWYHPDEPLLAANQKCEEIDNV